MPIGQGSHRRRHRFERKFGIFRRDDGVAPPAADALFALEADRAIRQALARYCAGVDGRDAALIRSAYHADAVDDHGSFVGSAFEFADRIVALLAPFELRSQHHVTNVLIELRDDRADVESYVLAFHPVHGEDGTETHALFGGRYRDRFERRSGEWKIAERRVEMDWTRAALHGDRWSLEAAFQRDSDPND